METLDRPFDHIRTDEAGAFAWSTVFAHRTDLPEKSGDTRHVAIVGAGLAGLVCGYELARRGVAVCVIEREARVGGRVHTHYFPDGQYGELGAMRVPAAHAAVMDYVTEFDLATRPFRNWNPSGRFRFGEAAGPIGCPDIRTAVAEYEALRVAFPDLRLVTPEHLAAGPQRMLMDLIVSPIYERIANDAARWDLLRSHSTHPVIRELRSTRLPDFATGPTVGMSDDDWRFTSRVTGVAPFTRCSVAQFLTDMVPAVGAPMVEIIGGMSRLPEAFEMRLRQVGASIVRAEATAIRVDDHEVTVTVEPRRGVSDQITVDAVVVTAPPTAAAAISITASDPVLTDCMAALHATEMGALAKTLLEFDSRFWEQSPWRIFGGLCSTSGPSLQSWYPVDNSKQIRDLNGLTRYIERDPLVTLGRGVITASYRWADGAEAFEGLADAIRLEQAVSDLSELFGLDESDVHQRILGTVHKMWSDGFTVLNSEAALDRQRTLNQPIIRGDGGLGLLFAGEHTCATHGWMISAVQAGLSAARDLLTGA